MTSKIDWQEFTTRKKMNPNGNISDMFKALKTDPKLLEQLKVKIIPYAHKPMYYKDQYEHMHMLKSRNSLDKGDVARLEVVTDDDGTHYVIYPPKQEPAFDVDKPSRVEEIFAENNWKAYWESEEEYPELNLQWVEEYFEDLYMNSGKILFDYQEGIAKHLRIGAV